MASNIVEILIGAKDDAKLDLDMLRKKLEDLAHTVAEAKAKIDDKEAEAKLDLMGVKLQRMFDRTYKAKIGLEGQFRMLAELEGLGVALDRVKKKADDGGRGGLLGGLQNLAYGGSRALESLGSAGTTFINPITIALAGLAAIMSGPLIASLLPITLGFATFGGIAAYELIKIEKAMTTTGKAGKKLWDALTPGEKSVGNQLKSIGAEFGKIQKAVQPEIIKAFAEALKIVKDLLPALTPLAKAAGKALDGLLKNIDHWLKSDSGKKFIKWLEVDGPKAIATFGRVMWDVVQGIGRTFAWLRNAGETWWKNFNILLHLAESAARSWYANLRAIFHGVSNALDALRESFIRVGHDIAAVFNSIKGAVGSAVDWIVGKIHTLTGALSSINGALGGIPGKILGSLGLATGGIAGAASGGVRSNLTLVGEHGPELVQLSAGSRVYNNAQSTQMVSQSGGGGPIVLEIRSGGGKLDDAIVEIIRKAVSVRGGGDVQVALGRKS